MPANWQKGIAPSTLVSKPTYVDSLPCMGFAWGDEGDMTGIKKRKYEKKTDKE
jgi:hypothetical protein